MKLEVFHCFVIKNNIEQQKGEREGGGEEERYTYCFEWNLLSAASERMKKRVKALILHHLVKQGKNIRKQIRKENNFHFGNLKQR